MTTINFIHQVIIGQMLSDGYILPSKNGLKGILKITFGQDHLPYGNYISDLLKEYSPCISVRVKQSKYGEFYDNYELRTKTHAEFSVYHRIFYKTVDGRFTKIVPSNILELICPVVLAHLLMGDGNHYKPEGRTRIYTNNFTYEECVLLAYAISTKFDIVCNVIKERVSKTGKSEYILTIGKKQLVKLQAVVGPHMHDSIKYRVGL